jgi:hypothetical protein
MSLSSPTLSYVSSRDINNVSDGASIFQIFFNQSLATAGNVIMFEYKIQEEGTIPDLDNTQFGYVAIQDAIQCGIVNQYIISVPADGNTLDGSSSKTIQVRVYSGNKSSSDVLVTEWSNTLNVYVPPVTPIIYHTESFDGAYYTPSYDGNNLYVLLDPSQNPYNYSNINFIVCYFYQDTSGSTVWGVSTPIQAINTTLGLTQFKLVVVENIGDVSTDNPYQKVYASIHAVYSWEDYVNNYHSVSFMSNEVVAIPGSEDNQPDITSVVYNVYGTPPMDNSYNVDPSYNYPGVQTMTVTWTAPGNSVIPFYAVDSYQLLVSLDGGSSFTELIVLSGNVLEYTVNVGSGGLGLNCGASIVYKVVAVTVTSAEEPSDPSSSTSIFKYSQSPSNLVITNATYDDYYDKVSLTVNFQGASNIGCGRGLQYVVLINDVSYNPSSGSLNYTAGTSYSIGYTGLPVAQTGTIKVFLQTENTNPSPPSPPSPLNGELISAPYIANNLVLAPVVYEVYTYGNDDQDMVLSWSLPALTGGWSVSGYTVQLQIGGSWTDLSANISNTTYTYDAISQASSVQNLRFRILANMANGSTSYVITSNVESQNTFKYATAPTSPIVNWVVANNTTQPPTTMDVVYQFSNPESVGVNNGLQYFLAEILDSSSDIINSQPVNYEPSANRYTVNANDITFSRTGTINIYSYVTDTNSTNVITYNVYVASVGYIASEVPQFVDVSVNALNTNTIVTGQILSYDLLKPVGVVTYPLISFSYGYPDVSLNDISYNTATGASGLVITGPTTGDNYEYVYGFTLTVEDFFDSQSVPGFQINAANDAGIGYSVVTLLPIP